MPQNKEKSDTLSSISLNEVDNFLEKVARTPVLRVSAKSGRLIFALDATASRRAYADRPSAPTCFSAA